MKGVVEVFQVKNGCWDKTYEEGNMVVHGGKVACADIFTHLPLEREDGSTPLTSTPVQSVSNYTINSLTLGAGKRTLNKRDSRHAVKYLNDAWGNNTYQYLDVSGSYYSLIPYRENFKLYQFGGMNGYKNSANKTTLLEYKGPSLRDSVIRRHSNIEVTETSENGGSLVFNKQLGQDFAEVQIPISLNLASDYKLSLGVKGDLPVKLELIRVDKITRVNSLNVDLRKHVWDFTQAGFVEEQTVSDKSRLSRTLHTSGVIAGEVHEVLFTTAFDKIDQGTRAELFNYFVKITAPQSTDFEKGSVTLHNFKLESLDEYILQNPNFNKVESLVGNTSFKDLTPYDLTQFTTGNAEDLKIMGVYQIGGFEHHSSLYASSNALSEGIQASSEGWISVDNVDAYGTSSSPPKVVDGNESNIGVSFNSKSFIFDNSGAATLSKRFKFPKKWTDFYTQTGSRFEQGYLNDPYSNRTLVIQFDSTPVSSVSNGDTGGSSQGVKVRCVNVTKGVSYNFVSGDLHESKSWGGSGTHQVLGAGLAMGTKTTLQANISMPLDFYKDEFKLDIIGHAGDAEDDAGLLTIRDLDIGQIEGWNINEGYASGVIVSSCAGEPVSGLRILTDQGQSPPTDWYEASSINRNTFISQTITGLDPKKIYNLIIEGKSNTGVSKVGVALIHKGYFNPYNTNHAKYFTLGDSCNAGNAFQNYFNPDTAVSGMGFTMPGPKGPPSDELASLDFKEHQKCVKWRLYGYEGTPRYKFIANEDSSYNGVNEMYVNLPNGRFNFSLDLRHFISTNDPYSYFYPVKLGLRVATNNPGALTPAFWYNFETRVWDAVTDEEGYNNKHVYSKTILQGSRAANALPSDSYYKVAKSAFEVSRLKGDPDGWNTASVAFDLRETDFDSAASRQRDYPEGHPLHTDWSTRPVEFWFYADQGATTPESTSDVDLSGTVYVKNAKLIGPPTPREQANTYYLYEGEGVWTATSSLSSIDNPISGHRPKRDVSAGTLTWNELGSTFKNQRNLDSSQQVYSIYGMDKLFNRQAAYGNTELYLGVNGSMVSSMWSAEKESVYELMLFHTVGSDLEIHNVSLTDAATSYYDGPEYWKGLSFTSEPFVSPVYLAHPGGWSIEYKQKTSAARISDKPPYVSTYVSGGADTDTYLRIINNPATPVPVLNEYHTTYTTYCDTLENFKMERGNRYAFAFDYAGVQNTMSEGVFAQWGNSLYWLSGTGSNTRWQEQPLFQDQTLTAATFRDIGNHAAASEQYVTKLVKDYVTPEFVIPTNTPMEALIGVKIKERPAHTSTWTSLKNNFRAYQVLNAVEVSSVMPDFPEEQDYTVQPLTEASTPGEFGHFQNAIEFYPVSGTAWDYPASTTAHIPTYEKAVSLGAYLPGSGLDFSAGAYGIDGNEASEWNRTTNTFSGTLNKYSSVTPKGHILKHPGINTLGCWMKDSSAGLTVSGPFHSDGATSDQYGRIVKYALTLTRDEVEYLSYYSGGIESAGLWTVNYSESAKKKHYKYGSPPFLVSGTGVPYSTSLYNLKDYEEPDWRLFAKKVFLAGGLKMHADSEFLTIIWSVEF